MEYGLAEATVDALVRADVGSVEKLGSMTPEQLEALEGIDAEAVNQIMSAINGFYGQEYGGEYAEVASSEANPAEASPEVAENAASATMSESEAGPETEPAAPQEPAPASEV
jgi:N utilization substance protein A